MNGYIKGVNDGTKALVQYFDLGDTSGIDPAIAVINGAPSFEKQADALLGELRSLLERAKRLNVKPGQGGSSDAEREQLSTDFNVWQQKNRNWAETTGLQYGIKRIESTPDKKLPVKK